MNWTLIKYLFGVLLLLEACFLAASTGVALYYHFTVGEEDWSALLSVTVVAAVIGYLLLAQNHRHKRQITTREGFFVVSLTWVIFCLLGMVPYLFTGACSTLGSAFLEAMSGFTTTGCTVIDNLELQPHGLLFWRHLTQWMGGLGIVVFSLALLPLIGTGATQVFGAETNGLSVDKLRPKIQQTAFRLWVIYLGLTLCNVLCYWLAGMPWFEAVCHSFSTMASGGFSTWQDSIGHYHSPAIEYICIVFLFITSVNYNLFYFMGRGYLKQTWRNEELRWFTYLVLGFTALFMFLSWVTRSQQLLSPELIPTLGDGSLECTFRTSLFHVLTIISSAGYQGEYFDYYAWGAMFWLPTLLMMAMGGCSSSTAGGLKVVRFVVLIKNAKQEIIQALQPRSVSAVRLNGHTLSHDVTFKVLAMLSIYMLLLVASIFLLQLMGLDFVTAVGSAVSALGNTGPALGQVGPAFTWASLPEVAKWYLSFLMLIGRLEIFTVIVLFTPMFWKK